MAVCVVGQMLCKYIMYLEQNLLGAIGSSEGESTILHKALLILILDTLMNPYCYEIISRNCKLPSLFFLLVHFFLR